MPRLVGHHEVPEAFQLFDGIFLVGVLNDIYHGVV